MASPANQGQTSLVSFATMQEPSDIYDSLAREGSISGGDSVFLFAGALV